VVRAIGFLVFGDISQGDVVCILPAQDRDGTAFDFYRRLAVLVYE